MRVTHEDGWETKDAPSGAGPLGRGGQQLGPEEGGEGQDSKDWGRKGLKELSKNGRAGRHGSVTLTRQAGTGAGRRTGVGLGGRGRPEEPLRKVVREDGGKQSPSGRTQHLGFMGVALGGDKAQSSRGGGQVMGVESSERRRPRK